MLVQAAADGDLVAFEALYRQYHKQIYLLCLRMTGRKELAEDHCQEAFIKAWQALSKFQGKSKFSSWVYRIAVNVVLGHQRKYQYEVFADQDWQQAFEDEFATSHNSQQIDLEKAIATLPMQAKNVLILHDLMGMTHKEIGESLEIAVGTCKAHLNRARGLVKEQLMS
ncbi:MAG: RNA polymerase sigma factor [Gammaproteobacteria bacterium]|nr:RNA polymerase sigma factor [Gammaproteobacteria bacterium]